MKEEDEEEEESLCLNWVTERRGGSAVEELRSEVSSVSTTSSTPRRSSAGRFKHGGSQLEALSDVTNSYRNVI